MRKQVLGWMGMLMLGMLGALALSVGGRVAALSPSATPTPIPDPVQGTLDTAALAEIELLELPEVPQMSEAAQALYARALAAGRDPHMFIKVGDCMTANPYYLLPIGAGEYDLGEYADLQRVIDHFSAGEQNAFTRESQAAAGGFNAASVVDSLWANPQFCEQGETPLACEIRLANPSVALIMFGTNDVQYLNAEQFDYFLRQVVVETMRANVLPILSTFPTRPEFPEAGALFNRIVAQVAADYDVPLINLWRALEPLPHQGVDPDDPTHLTTPAEGRACYFVGENLQSGFAVRNLLTLRALEAVLAAAETVE